MFLSDYDDLMSWLQDLLQHLSSDDLPQSLKASEEALVIHQERRVIISSNLFRDGMFLYKFAFVKEDYSMDFIYLVCKQL
jgi:hypothetical protein